MFAVIDTELLNKITEQGIAFLFDYGPKLLGAAIILVIGLVAALQVGKVLQRWLGKKDLEPPVRILIVRVVRLMVMGLTMMLVLEKVGVAIAPIIAGLGVAGVGVGLALQGVLGNLMAGLLIIFTKPFRVGEFIELLGVHGQVHAIDLFSVILVHADQSRVVIPNRKIIGEILHNYGSMRQLNLSVGVAYSTDINQAVAIVRAVLAANPRVLKNPEAIVGVCALADSSVNLAIKPWVKVGDYGAAAAEINQRVLEEFRKQGIEIPFPQREIRVLNTSEPAAIRAA
ncbi:MAG: mechanosensitive ion channel protein MscS [Pedosphaera sp. Tous-C6FEB]|nr:MAG: mechanosensitive ion channel protein MscS [Pedosphaera sp. Tous-C6FEB]